MPQDRPADPAQHGRCQNSRHRIGNKILPPQGVRGPRNWHCSMVACHPLPLGGIELERPLRVRSVESAAKLAVAPSEPGRNGGREPPPPRIDPVALLGAPSVIYHAAQGHDYYIISLK